LSDLAECQESREVEYAEKLNVHPEEVLSHINQQPDLERAFKQDMRLDLIDNFQNYLEGIYNYLSEHDQYRDFKKVFLP
jgi:hypothetical protein